MNFNISLAAFFGVAGLTVLVVCLMYIGISIRMQHAPSPANYDMHRQVDPNAENKDYSRSPDGIDHHMNIDSESVVTHRTDRTGVSVVSSIVDGEYTTHKQLHAAVFLLFGFLATWTFGAMAVTQVDLMKMLFSCLYGVGSAVLGIFIFVYNCALRNDVMYNWRRVCGRRRDSYAIAGSPAVQAPQPQSNGHVVQRRNSGSSIDSYNTGRSHNTNHSNHSHSVKSGSRKTTSKCNYIPSQTNTGTDASIDSSAQDTIPRPHMYEKHRGNGYTHRNQHKVRTRPKHYRQQRYDPLAVRYVEDPSDGQYVDLRDDASCAIPSGGESIASGHVSAPPMVLYSHRGGHEGGSLCLGYQPENVSMHSMHSMPAEPHKVPKAYQDGVLLTNFPYSMPSVTHTAPRKMPLKVPPPMPPRTASLDRRALAQHQRQPSSSQDESYKPSYSTTPRPPPYISPTPISTSTPYSHLQKKEGDKPVYAVIRPPSRDKNSAGRPLSRGEMSFDHTKIPSRESPYEHTKRREGSPYDQKRVSLSREQISLVGQRVPSQDHLSGHRSSQEQIAQIALANQRASSRDQIPLAGSRTSSRDQLPLSGQRTSSRDQIPLAGQRAPSRERVPMVEGRRPGIPDPPTYAQVMPDPEGQGTPRVVVGQDPEIDKAFNEIDDSMAAIMAASRELLHANNDNALDSDAKSDKKETSV